MIVVILPDGGRNYLSKLYNDEWMRANGLLAATGAVVARRASCWRPPPRPPIPDVVLARTTDRVGLAIDLLQEYGISQLPVSEQPDGRRARRDRRLGQREGAARPGIPRPGGRGPDGGRGHGPAAADDRRVRRRVDEAFALLSGGAAALLAVRGDRPAGVVTKLDLLEYLAHRG